VLGETLPSLLLFGSSHPTNHGWIEMSSRNNEHTIEMRKVKLGINYFSYPMPVTLVGTIVGDRVDFTTVAWMSRVNYRPPMLAVAINKKHYSPEGIRETRTFSVNIPSVDLLTQTDYCGTVSVEETFTRARFSSCSLVSLKLRQ